MKIQKDNKKLTRTLLPLGTVAFLILASAVYVYAFNGSLFGWGGASVDSSSNLKRKIDYSKPSKDQLAAASQIKRQSTDDKSTQTDTPSAPTPQPNSQKALTSISLTAKNQSRDILQLRTLIETPLADGLCLLTMQKGSTIVTKQAAINAQSKISTCAGFDIPMTELSKGSWALNIKIDHTSVTAELNESITLE